MLNKDRKVVDKDIKDRKIPLNGDYYGDDGSIENIEDFSGGGGGGEGTFDHRQLKYRDALNQHPISAITDLQPTLDNLEEEIEDLESKIPSALEEKSLFVETGFMTDTSQPTSGNIIRVDAPATRFKYGDRIYIQGTEYEPLIANVTNVTGGAMAFLTIDKEISPYGIRPIQNIYLFKEILRNTDVVAMYEAGGGSSGSTVHNDLTDRDVADTHPISSITNLQSTLDNKVTSEDGKSLTDNNFSDSDKEKLDGLNSFPEAPDDDKVYGRKGSTKEWIHQVHNDLDARDLPDAHPISSITDLDDLIPDQAVPITNELADKQFVNSSISNMAANYVAADAEGSAFPTRAAIESAIANNQLYSRGVLYTPTTNDYAVVLNDEGAPSPWTNMQSRWIHDGVALRRRYSYSVSFTAAEQAALDSGITSTLVDEFNSKVSFPEAPDDGSGYFRNGQIKDWDKYIPYILPQATETTLGGVALATQVEVRAKTNATDAITPARIPDIFNDAGTQNLFSAFDPNTMMGFRTIKTTSGPLFDLYGIATSLTYAVFSYGLSGSNNRIVQRAVLTAPAQQGQTFERYAHNDVSIIPPTWSTWKELPNGADKPKFEFYSVGKTSSANPTNIWHRAFTTTVQQASTTDWSSAIVVQGNYPADSAGSAFGILNIYMRGSNLRCRWHYRTSSINNTNFVLCSDANNPMKVELWVQAGNWQSYKLSILASGAMANRPNEANAWPPLQTNLDNGLTDIPADLVNRIVSTDNLPFSALGTQMPLIDSGTGAVGTSTKAAREDHVHPSSGGGGSTSVVKIATFDGTTPTYEVLTINNIVANKPIYIEINYGDNNLVPYFYFSVISGVTPYRYNRYKLGSYGATDYTQTMTLIPIATTMTIEVVSNGLEESNSTIVFYQ